MALSQNPLVKLNRSQLLRHLRNLLLIGWIVSASGYVLLARNALSTWREAAIYSLAIPVLLASFFYGRIGGLLVALIASLVSASTAIGSPDLLNAPTVQRILYQVIFLCLVALFTTALVERERSISKENARLNEESKILIEHLERAQHNLIVRNRALQTMLNTANALRDASLSGQVFPILLEQLHHIMPLVGAGMVLDLPEHGEIIIQAASGIWETSEGTRLPRDSCLLGAVVTHGVAYLPAKPRPELWGSLPLGISGSPPSLAILPLIHKQDTLGAVWIGSEDPPTEETIRLLSALADLASSALRRGRLHEQTNERLERILSLRAIDRAIANNLDNQTTLEIVLEQVIQQLRVHAAAIVLMDAHTMLLEVAAERGFERVSLRALQWYIGQGHTGKAALERVRVHVPNLRTQPDHPERMPLLERDSICSLISVPLIARGQVKGVLEVFHRAPLYPGSEWLNFLETLAGQTAIAIENSQLLVNLQRSNIELNLTYDTTLEGWSRALDLRDRETEGHTRRVAQMTVRLAREMGIGGENLAHIRRGALLHDIGKMGIPDKILQKTGKLDEDEWEIMRRHPEYAYQLLSPIEFLRPALDIPYCHHERWDGSGYPRGLKGEEIPLSARIFAVVDVWDALTSERPYNKPWSPEKVRNYIQEQSGKLFDPHVVEVFLDMI